MQTRQQLTLQTSYNYGTTTFRFPLDNLISIHSNAVFRIGRSFECISNETKKLSLEFISS